MNSLLRGLEFLLSLQILNAAAPVIPAVDPEAMAVDFGGNIYVVGTDSSGVISNPVLAFRTSFCGAERLCYDGFVMKLDSTGTKVLYATYLGGGGDDVITSVAVDAVGNAYVTGTTNSSDYPVTFDAASTSGSAFITKLNPDGSINYSTYLGGSGTNTPVGIQIDRFGNAYVAGATSSGDFPTTYSAYRGTPGPGFVSKINSTGMRFTYSTYFDAAPAAMAMDGNGSIYLTGHTQSPLTTTPGAMQSKLCGTDCSFVSVLNSNGSGLIYSSFLGGNAVTQTSSIALDPSGSIWVAGVTTATDFPSPSPAGGAFVVKINASRSSIIALSFSELQSIPIRIISLCNRMCLLIFWGSTNRETFMFPALAPPEASRPRPTLCFQSRVLPSARVPPRCCSNSIPEVTLCMPRSFVGSFMNRSFCPLAEYKGSMQT